MLKAKLTRLFVSFAGSMVNKVVNQSPRPRLKLSCIVLAGLMMIGLYSTARPVASQGNSGGLQVVIANTPDVIMPTQLGKVGLTMTVNGASTNVMNFNGTVAEYVDPSNYSSPVTSFCSGTWLSGFENSIPEPNGTRLIPISNIPYTFGGTSGGKYYNGSEAIFEYTAYSTVEIITESGLNPPIKGGYRGENNFFDTNGVNSQGKPIVYLSGQSAQHPAYFSPFAGGGYASSVGINPGTVFAGGSGAGQPGCGDGHQSSTDGIMLMNQGDVQGALCIAMWDTQPVGGSYAYRTNTMTASQLGTQVTNLQGSNYPWYSLPQYYGANLYTPTYATTTSGPYAGITSSICPINQANATYNAAHPFSTWPDRTQVLGESSARPVNVASTVHIVANTQSINKTQQYPVTFLLTNGSYQSGYVNVQAVSAVVGFGANGLNYILTPDANYSKAIPNLNGGNNLKLYSQRVCKDYFNSLTASVTNASSVSTSSPAISGSSQLYTMQPTLQHEIIPGSTPQALTGSVEVMSTQLETACDATATFQTPTTSMPRSSLGAGITPNIYDITHNCGLPKTLTITANSIIGPKVSCAVANAQVNSTCAEQIGSYWLGDTNEWYITNSSMSASWIYGVNDTNWIMAQNFTFPITIFSDRNYQCVSSSGHPINLASIVNFGNNSLQNSPLLDDLKVVLYTPVINGSPAFNFVQAWNALLAELQNFLNSLLNSLGQYGWVIVVIIAVICIGYFSRSSRSGGSKVYLTR